MAPIILLDRHGDFVAALGSPGGNAILEYNAKALVGLLAPLPDDWLAAHPVGRLVNNPRNEDPRCVKPVA